MAGSSEEAQRGRALKVELLPQNSGHLGPQAAQISALLSKGLPVCRKWAPLRLGWVFCFEYFFVIIIFISCAFGVLSACLSA